VLLALLALASAGATASAGAAEPADARSRARDKLIEAETLYDAGDFARSLERLEEAAAIYPSPRLHFNFGLAYRALGRDTDAIEAFERFLAETRDDPEMTARRTEATWHAEALAARVGTLEVVSEVAGADVIVDGRARGKTPLGAPLRVAPGSHDVVVLKVGSGTPFLQRVHVRAGGRVRIAASVGAVAASGPDLRARANPAEPPRTPVYRRWWVWAGAGIVLAGGVLAGALAARDRSLCKGTCNWGEVPIGSGRSP
jgi:hypothetical protein